jgi:hypothetical protein
MNPLKQKVMKTFSIVCISLLLFFSIGCKPEKEEFKPLIHEFSASVNGRSMVFEYSHYGENMSDVNGSCIFTGRCVLDTIIFRAGDLVLGFSKTIKPGKHAISDSMIAKYKYIYDRLTTYTYEISDGFVVITENDLEKQNLEGEFSLIYIDEEGIKNEINDGKFRRFGQPYF